MEQALALSDSFNFEQMFRAIYGVEVINTIKSIYEKNKKNQATKGELYVMLIKGNCDLLDTLCEKKEMTPADFEKLLDILVCLQNRGMSFNTLKADYILELLEQEKYPKVHEEECFVTIKGLIDGQMAFDPKTDMKKIISYSLLHMCDDVEKLLNTLVWFCGTKTNIGQLLQTNQTFFIELMTKGFSGTHNSNNSSDILDAFPIKIGNETFRMYLRCSGTSKRTYCHQNQLDDIIPVYELVEVVIRNLETADKQ
jgi:hypothetical protein